MVIKDARDLTLGSVVVEGGLEVDYEVTDGVGTGAQYTHNYLVLQQCN